MQEVLMPIEMKALDVLKDLNDLSARIEDESPVETCLRVYPGKFGTRSLPLDCLAGAQKAISDAQKSGTLAELLTAMFFSLSDNARAAQTQMPPKLATHLKPIEWLDVLGLLAVMWQTERELAVERSLFEDDDAS